MRMRYLGPKDAMHEPVVTDADGRRIPMRDLTREEGIEFRDAIHANEKATGIKLFEAIHEPKDADEKPAKAETNKPAKADSKGGE